MPTWSSTCASVCLEECSRQFSLQAQLIPQFQVRLSAIAAIPVRSPLSVLQVLDDIAKLREDPHEAGRFGRESLDVELFGEAVMQSPGARRDGRGPSRSKQGRHGFGKQSTCCRLPTVLAWIGTMRKTSASREVQERYGRPHSSALSWREGPFGRSATSPSSWRSARPGSRFLQDKGVDLADPDWGPSAAKGTGCVWWGGVEMGLDSCVDGRGRSCCFSTVRTRTGVPARAAQCEGAAVPVAVSCPAFLSETTSVILRSGGSDDSTGTAGLLLRSRMFTKNAVCLSSCRFT